MDTPLWIVNDLGELGVQIAGRCFFLYKGGSLEYATGCHDDGSPMLYRRVGKREFGEVCQPDAYYRKGHAVQGRYTEPVVLNPLLWQGDTADYAWKPLPPVAP